MKKNTTPKKAAAKKTGTKGNTKKIKAPDEELARLAKRIKDIRQEKGYTNYENFAFENNINRSQFGRYENGEDLRYTSLIRVIRAFGITIEEFFKGMK